MKKSLIFIVICLGAWQFYFKDSAIIESSKKTAVTEFSNSAAMKTLAAAKEIAKPKPTYKCDGRQYCSQMGSFEEAKYFIQHCPNTKMDNDKDGAPCKSQFNK